MKLAGVEQLPHALVVKAISLRNGSRKIYIALCNCKEPKSASEVAELVGESRAHVSMRLNELVDLDLVKKEKGKHPREKLFTVIQ